MGNRWQAVCSRERESKFLLMKKWPWQESWRAWWSCPKVFALHRSDVEDHRASHDFNTGICNLNQNLFLVTGNWKHVFEVVLPSHQTWHHELWPSSALPSASFSRLTLSKRPLWRVRCTLESLPLPYPVFNKNFLYDCSLVLDFFLSRHTWSWGSPCCEDHWAVKAAGPQLPLPWATWHQRPGQGCRLQISSLWMTGNGIFDQKVFPNNHCITTF